MLTHSQHALDMGAASEFGEDWDPIPGFVFKFVFKRWRRPMLPDEPLKRVEYTALHRANWSPASTSVVKSVKMFYVAEMYFKLNETFV